MAHSHFGAPRPALVWLVMKSMETHVAHALQENLKLLLGTQQLAHHVLPTQYQMKTLQHVFVALATTQMAAFVPLVNRTHSSQSPETVPVANAGIMQRQMVPIAFVLLRITATPSLDVQFALIKRHARN